MHRRIQVTSDPLDPCAPYAFGSSPWAAKWIGPAAYDPNASIALVFRREFEVTSATKLKMHISCDQKYELYIDGEYVGRGIERSDLKNWVYESYALELTPGRHKMVVRVWWLAAGAPAPEAQQTHRPGLLVMGEGSANEMLSTGVADWQYQVLPGYSFHDHDRLQSYFATGAQLNIDGRQINSAAERGDGEGWQKPASLAPAMAASRRQESHPWWILRPAFLPEMYEKQIRLGKARHVEAVASADTTELPVKADASISTEQSQWDTLLMMGKRFDVPPNTKRRIIIDLGDYYCAFPMVRCTGEGAHVRFHSAESLYDVQPGHARQSGNPKRNRDEIEGKCFFGVGFEFTTSLEPITYSTHAFMAGRYIEIYVETADVPLTIESIEFLETHFPFRFKAKFSSSDPGHKKIIPIALRTLEMCSHDTSMDCPYYERLNYVGDTRLQTLVAYASANEERLGRKCIELFDLSRQPSGLTYSRYPTRTTQTIPTFSLWWASMVYDFALWRDDLDFVSERMRGVRSVLEFWRDQRDEKSGLLQAPAGWNFVDWVPTWKSGVPADGHCGFNSIINLQAVYTLRLAAQLEELLDEPLLARRDRDFANQLAATVKAKYYNKAKGLFADDLSHEHFSEHAQCMAILSGTVTGASAKKLARTMLSTAGLAQATIYFSHYLFEALGYVGEIDPLLRRLDLWKTLADNGFRTTFESPEPTRSDCHAWGAHPVYHFLATVAGIRPTAAGFKEVVIRPQLGSLTEIKGSLPHPNGPIAFEFTASAGHLSGTVALPEDLPGTIVFGANQRKLKAGENKIRF